MPSCPASPSVDHALIRVQFQRLQELYRLADRLDFIEQRSTMCRPVAESIHNPLLIVCEQRAQLSIDNCSPRKSPLH
jgi:hypothetical protein